MSPLARGEQERIARILEILSQATKSLPATLTANIIRDYGKDPFVILISCLLSLRARDTMTYPVSRALFARARTPQAILSMDEHELEQLLKPIGFYRKKAHILKDVCQQLIERFQGQVPRHEADLLSIKGVGRKTAALVLSEAFDTPAICVDAHVHRVANRLGIIATKTPEETEKKLKTLIPREYWSRINQYLVVWGQNICTPISPFCSICPLAPYCPKRGVSKHR